jgi:uncharacterized protein (TIGR00299 family) protein
MMENGMKIAYFDCIAGASGDMILGALLDVGLPIEALRARLGDLDLVDFEVNASRVVKNGFSATKVDVIVTHAVPERHLAEIVSIIKKSRLPADLQEKAISIFDRLARTEAAIHGLPLDQVHLHELGGVDTIVDVVGALIGLDALGIQKVYASPLPLGRGFVTGAHGQIPLPAPATLALLQGIPVVGSPIEKELVTPTGAVLLSSLAASFGQIPPMTLQATGYGSGGWDLPIPNLLRLLVGEQVVPSQATTETLVLLATNIDDLNPQVYDFVMARLFAAGALDVTLSPLQMKKNRPAVQLQVLCQPSQADPLSAIIFSETSTLGIRKQFVERQALHRSIHVVETSYGPVRVKTAQIAADQVKATPEYDDCRRLAETHGVPLREVYQAAEIAIEMRRLTEVATGATDPLPN